VVAKYTMQNNASDISKKRETAFEKRFLIPESATDEFFTRTKTSKNAFQRGLRAWVDAHSKPRSRSVAEALAGEISYVSYQDFSKELGRSLAWLNGELKGQRYQLVVQVKPTKPLSDIDFRFSNQPKNQESQDKKRIPKLMMLPDPMTLVPKSSAWLGHFAERHLTRAELSGLVIVDDENNRVIGRTSSDDVVYSRNKSSKTQDDPGKYGTKIYNLVIVDDASYSGEQVRRLIKTLVWYLENDKANNKIKKPSQNVLTRIYVVVPYRTQRAQEMLLSMSATMGYTNNITTNNNNNKVEIHVCPEFRTMKETRQILRNAGVKAPAHVCDHMGAMTVFEHKVPNGASFPATLAEGHTVDDRGVLGEWTPRVPFLPAGDPRPYDSTRVVGVARHMRGGFLDDTLIFPSGDRPKQHVVIKDEQIKRFTRYLRLARAHEFGATRLLKSENVLSTILISKDRFSLPVRKYVEGLIDTFGQGGLQENSIKDALIGLRDVVMGDPGAVSFLKSRGKSNDHYAEFFRMLTAQREEPGPNNNNINSSSKEKSAGKSKKGIKRLLGFSNKFQKLLDKFLLSSSAKT
jgi:hypothetical protein